MLKIFLFLCVIVQNAFTDTTTPTPSVNEQLNKLESQLTSTNNQIQDLASKINEIHNLLKKQNKNTNKLLNENQRRLDAVENHNYHTPKNCREVLERGFNISGIYRIKPALATESFMVLCDMKTRGGGWTYFLNRFDGSQDFYLNWTDYKKGFGNLAGEFWLGLEKLYQLIGYVPNELLIELVDWDKKKVYAHYSAFSIGSESEGYNIRMLGAYNGSAGDSFTPHVGMKFSTFDKDQDIHKSANCAVFFTGAWWYNKCSSAVLTGKYRTGTVNDTVESIMYWNTFRGNKYSLKQARMMVKPRDITSSPILPHEVDT